MALLSNSDLWGNDAMPPIFKECLKRGIEYCDDRRFQRDLRKVMARTYLNVGCLRDNEVILAATQVAAGGRVIELAGRYDVDHEHFAPVSALEPTSSSLLF